MDKVKRNEHTLPTANWLRDQINETLARYDIPSDVYDTDILIDALCVCAVDKAQADLRARLEAVEKERDEIAQSLHEELGEIARLTAAAETARREATVILAAAILDAQLRVLEQGRLDTPAEITAKARALADEAPE